MILTGELNRLVRIYRNGKNTNACDSTTLSEGDDSRCPAAVPFKEPCRLSLAGLSTQAGGAGTIRPQQQPLHRFRHTHRRPQQLPLRQPRLRDGA